MSPGETVMAKEEEIKKWQESLFEAFAYNDVLGGRYLSPAMGIEKVVGSVFVDKYRGHRVLTDAFMDFLGATIWAQAEYNNANGWPQKSPYYVTCLLMYLTMFRSFRAAELLSLHGYPLQGYVLQRSLKDQAYCLCAAANGMATFGELFGWEDIGEITEERYATVIKNRRKIEEQTRDQLVGSKSGLSAEAQHELLQWERLFNFEAHRGLFTLFRAVRRVLVQKKLEMVLGPTPDEMNESITFQIAPASPSKKQATCGSPNAQPTWSAAPLKASNGTCAHISCPSSDMRNCRRYQFRSFALSRID
jgi:hypothetical protein